MVIFLVVAKRALKDLLKIGMGIKINNETPHLPPYILCRLERAGGGYKSDCKMKCGHLFNGIGGFALAAHWMGWANVMHCEIDPFCNQVMNKHFPNSYQHEDIRTTDFTIWRGKIDLLTGGDPCQPSSVAGKREGEKDERYLWPENYRAIEEILPAVIVNENVTGTVSNGILDQKINDLEAIGYAWWPPLVIPASSIGADHKRERVWLVAYANSKRLKECNITTFTEKQAERYVRNHSQRSFEYGSIAGYGSISEILREANGFSERLDPGLRNAGIKAFGNAIVPQVGYQIFKAIEQYLACQ